MSNIATVSTLKIRLTRRPGKLPLLICMRADGTSTMDEIAVGPEHDLAHFAVETTLGLRRAFYGLVAGGMNIQDFNVPGAAKKLNLPVEAVHAEFIVGLLQAERRSDCPYADFNAELLRALANGRTPIDPPAPVTERQLGEIRALLDELVGCWTVLPPDGTLELTFSM